MAGNWMRINSPEVNRSEDRPNHYNDRVHEVRYSTPGLGFTVTKTVTGEIADMLDVSRKAGYEEAQRDIRKALGITN